jgi:hypothetical protein
VIVREAESESAIESEAVREKCCAAREAESLQLIESLAVRPTVRAIEAESMTLMVSATPPPSIVNWKAST